LSGQVTQSGPGAPGPQGQAQNNPAAPQAGQGAPSAPTPSASPALAAAPAPAPGPAPAPAPTAEQRQRVETAAQADDIKACKDAAQQMRRAGVKLPDPLLALAALDLKFLEGAKQP
jgi:type IV secretory pathway VirB10-like protein